MFENLKKSIIGDLEENTEEKKEANTQGDRDESIKLILILILIILTIGVSIYGFTALQNYQKTEKQYQNCLTTCKSLFGQEGLDYCKTMCDLELGK